MAVSNIGLGDDDFRSKFSFFLGLTETPFKKKREVKQRPPERLSSATAFISPRFQAQLQPVMAEQAQIPTFKLVLVGDGGTGKVTFRIQMAARLRAPSRIAALPVQVS